MILDHVSIVVPDMERGIERWMTFFGYEQMTAPVVNTRQQVKVVFLKKEGSLPVKLIEPTSESSPIYRFARRGGGLHHICFKADSVDKAVQDLEEKGARVLSRPQPGEAFDNEKIAFCYCEPGTNVEIIDTDKRALKL